MRIVFPDGAGCVQHPSELEPLRKLGQVDFYDGPPPDRATLIERLRPAEAVVLDYSEMDAEILRACERLRFVSFLGIGYNSCIDVAEATRRGIAVAFTPDYGATSVAEHALAMILALTRHIGPAFVSAREGRWEPGRFVGMELRGKTLGIRGPALDVHETEPIPPGEYVFRTLRNVLITPHIGYNTREASANMLRIAIETVQAFARGERLHVVNGV